jgi:heat shock protein HtpX
MARFSAPRLKKKALQLARRAKSEGQRGGHMRHLTPGTIRAALMLVAMGALFAWIGSLVFDEVGMAAALTLSIVISFWSFWTTGAAIIRATGARELTVEKDRGLLDIVSKLSADAGLPMPRVFEISDGAPNALAVGANPSIASLILTKSVRKLLPKDQIAPLIAHELGHIKARDTLAATVGGMFLNAILSVALVLAFFGMAARKSGGGLMIALAIFTPMITLVLHLAASRSREYEADRYGAELLGSPEPMIAVLHKLAALPARPNKYALHAPATASLWFIDPLAGTWLHNLFSTHPTIPRRIERLERLPTSKP